MCTVTFIPVGKSVFITHSRDERNDRPAAALPAMSKVKGINLLFPKDGQARGSWVGFNEFGQAAALMNGAFEKHIQEPPYKKSRGLIFLDLLATSDLRSSYQNINLKNIEPFTLVMWSNRKLLECRWDGWQKHVSALDAETAQMWSSSTLYDRSASSKRLSWFREWRKKKPVVTADDIIKFHLEGGEGDEHNDLKMKRGNEFSTLSITCMQLSMYTGKMKYIDLRDHHSTENTISFKTALAQSR